MGDLPGEDLIEAGIADLARRIDSVAALVVSVGAPRLRALGFAIPEPICSPEVKLYSALQLADPDNAHSRYNALIRRLVSFEQATALRQAHSVPGPPRDACAR